MILICASHRTKGRLEIQTNGFTSTGLSLQDTSVSKKDEAAQPVSFSHIIENPFTQQHSMLQYNYATFALTLYKLVCSWNTRPSKSSRLS